MNSVKSAVHMMVTKPNVHVHVHFHVSTSPIPSRYQDTPPKPISQPVDQSINQSHHRAFPHERIPVQPWIPIHWTSIPPSSS